MPAGYLYQAGIPPPLLGQAMPPLAPTWLQAAPGAARIPGIRDHRQTHPSTTLADPSGYGLGVTQQTTRQTGTIWDRLHCGL